ncbi:DUF368 domain-containing protein [Corynebacterium auriscanis]|uniref:DUF368 domain-containing protein n=1 Tax=Corynebacterium auriscanis TaxID=99807 RepID=UPI00224593E2|nr:DUF368 domain-containing protein [Corynebacterium auriscanis]MCX2163230.1 DUF368 domain-containing protein [Corynebacterium auriscanis]
MKIFEIIANLIRGGLVGMAELVPGVSGGTIALVTGIYERVLFNANRFLDAAKTLPSNRPEAMRRFGRLDWLLLIPLLLGMGAVVVTMSGVMESFVTDHPSASRALFFGMVLVSISVPLTMIAPLRQIVSHCLKPKYLPATIAALVAAVATFLLTGITSAPQSDPNLLIVYCAAAVAICALVLPGVSGSFFLLAVGLYSATLAAVSDRDLTYIAVFAAGALTGIVLFVRSLEKLLTRHRTMTLSVMAGLMLGSLRALWPWQDSDATLQSPSGDLWTHVGLMSVGALAVLVMLFVERKFGQDTPDDHVYDHTTDRREGSTAQ